MGNTDTKVQFRKAIVQLTSKSSPIDTKDDEFWDQFWSDSVNNVNDVFALIPAAEIRALREESPSNLATLVYKAVEKLVRSTDTLCNTSDQQIVVLNSCRILTRILPYIFEDPDWRGFFWSKLSASCDTSSKDADGETDSEAEEAAAGRKANRKTGTSGSSRDSQDKGGNNNSSREAIPLAHSLITALCDLLFCPDFTVSSLPCRRGRFGAPDTPPEDLQSIDSCEYIWESGVGFTSPVRSSTHFDGNRIEIMRLLLTCFSSCMYLTPQEANSAVSNKWIEFFTSGNNRHALPLFTSLLNTIISYDPNGFMPFNHLFFSDRRELLVDVCVQILIVTLDYDYTLRENQESIVDHTLHDNLFINYLARIHREEDFSLILRGLARLLNNPLQQTYLPNSIRRIQFHQELLVLFWKVCDYNKKFMYYVLKSSDVLEFLVPILYHLNESRCDQARIGLVHIGVFILLLLSGERNFGVRLNKPYNSKIQMDVPIFSGTHADLLIIVFHKLITAGHQRLQPLFDCLLTIIVNVSPYLKTLSMVTATKILHLMEAFSTPWFLYSNPTNHHLVFFLLEIFNNMIQYQFDGNSNLIYTIIRKRVTFHALSNLSTDQGAILRSLNKQQAIPNKKSVSSASLARQASSGGAAPSSKSFPSLAPGETVRIQSVHPTPSPSSSSQSSTPRPLRSPIADPSSNDDVFGINSTLLSLAATPKLNRMTEIRHAHVDPDPDHPDQAGGASGPDTPTSAGAVRVQSPSHLRRGSSVSSSCSSKQQNWQPTPEWVQSWKSKLPLQTIMRMLQVLVPQVEKMCIDKGITEESEILKFLQHGTLVGLLPVPHPILIRKYQTNAGTTLWFRTYMWGVIYLRNSDPAIWYDTNVQLFEIQKL